MNYFDDLRITSCGFFRDPGTIEVPRGNASRRDNPEIACPVCHVPCRMGWPGAHSIGVIHGPVFRRERDCCREMPAAFLYWLRDEEYFSWCNPRHVPHENRWIVFKGPRGDRLLDALDRLTGGEHFYALEDPQPAELRFDEISRLFHSLTPATEYRVLPLFEEMIAALYDRARAEAAGSRIFLIVKEAEKRMRQNPEIRHDFAEFAAAHQISYDYFRDSFRRYIGVPPHDFLLNCRLETARRLLREEPSGIKVIAGMCGFDRPSDFTRFFRKRTGMSPSEFIRTPGL